MSRSKSDEWFRGSREGLRQMAESQGGKPRALMELWQNAWDQSVTCVEMKIEPVLNRPLVWLSMVDDDPVGFADLAHTFTLFAESPKKSDPTKRGRFNLGEKLVLALCDEATVTSTTGTVSFHANGRRTCGRRRREKGTEFCAFLRMTRKEHDEVMAAIAKLIPPNEIVSRVNGVVLATPAPILEFQEVLPTVVADQSGCLRPSRRNTLVRLYGVRPGEEAMLYEMGIPVVATGDKYHVDVQQKVPLTMDRTNVTAAFLGAVRVAVVNHTVSLLAEAEVTAPWVQEAIGDVRCTREAFLAVQEKQYGTNVVAIDPRSPESKDIAVSAGFTVIPGGARTRQQWENARRFGATPPASQVFPAPGAYNSDPRAPKATIVPPREWSAGMRRVASFATMLAKELMGTVIRVDYVDTVNDFTAAYARDSVPEHLDFNLRHAGGEEWFDEFPANIKDVVELLLHEFAHHYEGNHLSHRYHEAVSRLGASACMLAASRPDLFASDPA